MAKGDVSSDLSFLVQLTGQIESGDFGPHDNLYCRYSLHYGSDWNVVSVRTILIRFHSYNYLLISILQGIDTGLSQTARRSVMNNDDGMLTNSLLAF